MMPNKTHWVRYERLKVRTLNRLASSNVEASHASLHAAIGRKRSNNLLDLVRVCMSQGWEFEAREHKEVDLEKFGLAKRDDQFFTEDGKQCRLDFPREPAKLFEENILASIAYNATLTDCVTDDEDDAAEGEGDDEGEDKSPTTTTTLNITGNHYKDQTQHRVDENNSCVLPINHQRKHATKEMLLNQNYNREKRKRARQQQPTRVSERPRAPRRFSSSDTSEDEAMSIREYATTTSDRRKKAKTASQTK